jgi:hypothetical protein
MPRTHPSIEHLTPGIRRYVDNHIETGSFLRAVLENDLRGACARAADIGTRWALFELVTYLEASIPPECWGSPERVQQWISQRDETTYGGNSK